MRINNKDILFNKVGFVSCHLISHLTSMLGKNSLLSFTFGSILCNWLFCLFHRQMGNSTSDMLVLLNSKGKPDTLSSLPLSLAALVVGKLESIRLSCDLRRVHTVFLAHLRFTCIPLSIVLVFVDNTSIIFLITPSFFGIPHFEYRFLKLAHLLYNVFGAL